MVRTLHHAADARSVLQGVARILAPGGTVVLEFANKRNLKAMARYVTGRQTWSPWDREPVEFVELNFDFHPAWVEARLGEAGLTVRERLAVSTFRLGVLKRLVPTGMLVALDRLCQRPGGLAPLSPSIFVRCEAETNEATAEEGAFFPLHRLRFDRAGGGGGCPRVRDLRGEVRAAGRDLRFPGANPWAA